MQILKKLEHVKEECYKLVVYPQHFKFNKQRKGLNGNQQVNAAICENDLTSGIVGDTVSTLVASQGFTKEQCDQLIQMSNMYMVVLQPQLLKPLQMPI